MKKTITAIILAVGVLLLLIGCADSTVSTTNELVGIWEKGNNLNMYTFTFYSNGKFAYRSTWEGDILGDYKIDDNNLLFYQDGVEFLRCTYDISDDSLFLTSDAGTDIYTREGSSNVRSKTKISKISDIKSYRFDSVRVVYNMDGIEQAVTKSIDDSEKAFEGKCELDFRDGSTWFTINFEFEDGLNARVRCYGNYDSISYIDADIEFNSNIVMNVQIDEELERGTLSKTHPVK